MKILDYLIIQKLKQCSILLLSYNETLADPMNKPL